MNRLYFVLLLLCVSSRLHGQSLISGRVIDSLGQGIANASISYKALHEPGIRGYSSSGSDGSFSLTVQQTALDSIELIVSHLAFEKRTIPLINKTSSQTVRLSENRNLLQEVNIKPLPVYRRKDTLNFNVEAFMAGQDRVIGDVIRKLPGIEMQGDQLFYQGKPIAKYMVNKLDLMGGRYGIINDNLPADAVRRIQVIEQDQPIKILDSLVQSDRASINIELKRFTTTGTGNIGLGYEPYLWDVRLTPMTFDKTFQSLYTFQSNNAGRDISQQLRPYYTSGPIGSQSTERDVQDGPSFTAIQDVSVPAFDERKWLDNRIFLGNANVLKLLSNGTELRGTLSYHQDLQKREGFTRSEILIPDATLILAESVSNRYHTKNLSGGVLLERNEERIYLKNNLHFQKSSRLDKGTVLLNEEDEVHQNNQYDDYNVFNHLAVARLIGKWTVTGNSLIEYGKTPQSLFLVPGQFANVFNQGSDFASLKQKVSFSDFKTENSVHLLRSFQRWTLNTQLGIDYRRSLLESSVIKDDLPLIDEGFGNDQLSAQTKAYVVQELGYHKNGLRLTLDIPFYLHLFNLRQQEEKRMDNTLRAVINPKVRLNYEWGSNHRLTAGSAYDSRFRGFDDLYDAYIVSSYRNMSKYQAGILSSRSFNNYASYHYTHTRKATFANFSYAHQDANQSYTFQSTIDAEGLTTVSIADQNSKSTSHHFSGDISKFFSGSKTIFKLRSSINFGQSDFLLNQQLSRLNNNGFFIEFEAMNRTYEFINVTYKHGWRLLKSSFMNSSENRVSTENVSLDLSAFLSKQHSILVNNSYYRNNSLGQKNQLFMDLTYRFTKQRSGIDLELSCINLLNNNQYTQRINVDYLLMESYFNLRPRQFMISSKFRF